MTIDVRPARRHPGPPECPDHESDRRGPNRAEAALRAQAEAGRPPTASRASDRWRGGFTRRRVIAGAGAVGVAALGSQLVDHPGVVAALGVARPSRRTNAHAHRGLPARRDGRAVGGRPGATTATGLGPAATSASRPPRCSPPTAASACTPALAPLHAVLEGRQDGRGARGRRPGRQPQPLPGAGLPRARARSTAGTPAGSTGCSTRWARARRSGRSPRARRCPARWSAARRSWCSRASRTSSWPARTSSATRPSTALAALYTGFDHPLAAHVAATLQALDRGPAAGRTGVPGRRRRTPAAASPTGCRDVAHLIKATSGLRVAAIDVGGWDMHTNLGTRRRRRHAATTSPTWPTRSARSPPTSAPSSTTSPS